MLKLSNSYQSPWSLIALTVLIWAKQVSPAEHSSNSDIGGVAIYGDPTLPDHPQ